MRALTVEELGFVSGGSAFGGGGPGWQSLGAEVVIVTGQRNNNYGPATDEAIGNSDSYENTYLQLARFWNSLDNNSRAQIVGGALIAVGGGIALAAALTPAGALVWGVMAISTANFAGYGLVTVGGVGMIAGTLADLYGGRG